MLLNWWKGGRERGNRLIRFSEVKSAREIANRGTTPCAQVGHFGAKTCLEESQHRGVIEESRRYKPTPAERGDHKHRHTKTQADGAENGRIADHRGVRDCGGNDVLAGSAGGGRYRCDVVKEAAIIVVGGE